MSFGFGKNSGPTAPHNGQTPFGHFPHPPSPAPSPSPFSVSNLSAGPRFPSPRSYEAHVRPRSPPLLGNERAERSYSYQKAAPIRTFDANVRPRSPPSRGNDRSATSYSQQHAALIRTFDTNVRPRSPPALGNDRSATSYPQQRAAPTPIRTLDDNVRPQSLPSLGNDHSATSYSQQHAAPAPIRTFDAPVRPRSPHSLVYDHSAASYSQHVDAPNKHDKQNMVSRVFSSQSQKRPFPSPSQDRGTNMSSKVPHFQDLERSRSPPIQYNDDFLLDSREDITHGDPFLRRHAKQNPVSGDFGRQSQKRPFLSTSQDLGTSISSQHPHLQNTESSRSPIQYNDDFLLDPDGDVKLGPSLSQTKLRSGTTGVGRPHSQYNQELSPFDDEMNGDTNITRPVNHSVPKRTRSPSSAVGQIIKPNSYSPEDDADREQQAKAKRLARFKAELVNTEPGDSIRFGQNVTKGKFSSMKSDRTPVEKPKFSGDFPSGSMEDQDFDNEDLKSNSVIVGLCTDMCPESEREERERKGDLDQYERVDGDRNQSSRELAVKKYNRTAEREAELIRPMPILLNTMDYLLGLLDQSYDDKFLGLYNFLWDRMRAIRMDLRMQHIFNERAITMLEQMIRLHIIAMHELCEFSKGEGFSEGFDAHLNIEQMNKTSVELFQLYDDHRKRGIFIPTEKEFRGYYALLKLDKHPGYKVEPAELSLDLAQMTAEIRQTLEVLFARDVARSCRTSNFIAFFRHARNAGYLQACLMHAHFSKLRTMALASLHSGLQYNQGLPVAHAAKWLGMEGEDIESLLEYHGFSIKDFEEPYMVKEGPFLNDEKDFPTRRSMLVHSKKSNTILEDVQSSHQVMLLPQSKPSKESPSDENRKIKLQAVHSIKKKSLLISDDALMDIEAVSSPKRRMQDPPILKTPTRSIVDTPIFEAPRSLHVLADLITSRDGQSSSDDYHRVSAGSPRDKRVSASSPRDNRVSAGSPRESVKPFASFSHSFLNQPSPLTQKHGPLIADAKDSPWSSSVQQFVPTSKSSYIGLGKQDNWDGPINSSSDFVSHSGLKSLQPEVVSTNVGEVLTPVSVADSSVVSLLQDDVSLKEASEEEITDAIEKVDEDIDDNYDEEVAEAKLRLLLRLWRRRFLRKKYIREQNKIAANAALSSLNLGPPIRQNRDKTTPCKKLNIDQAMNERYRKRQMSFLRWNVSDLVASKLAERNENSNCICWKVISFSWLQHGKSDIKAESSLTHLRLDEWLRYKLIPARKEEAEEELVISAPGLSVWRKWTSDHSGQLRCYFSVIKSTQPGNFEKKPVGVNAIIFPISETRPWDIQKAQLNNLVASLPTGACIPLLIISDSHGENFAEVSCTIVNKLGLNDLNKSHICRFMVICLNEEGNAQFNGYFSDEKLKEGLLWLASESYSQPILFSTTIRELVSHHLNSCLETLDLLGNKVGPSQCISAFNQALDQSINDIITASNTNPIGWPCPELFLMDDSSAELRAVKQFLPTLEWSSSEEVGPLISSLKNSMLPSFPEDISWLNRGCTSEKDIEDQKQLLQDSLIRYLTQSGNLLNLMMATNEARLMVQKCTRLELYGTVFKVVPNWVLISRRVFNWLLNSSTSFSRKAYVLEQSLKTRCSPILDKLEPETPKPYYISQPSLDEMVEVSCSPIVSKRVRSSPKSFQKVAAITSGANTTGITLPDFMVEERNQSSEIQVVDNSDIDQRKNDQPLVRVEEKKVDRLSQLLDQCSILQDEIEKKLSFYF